MCGNGLKPQGLRQFLCNKRNIRDAEVAGSNPVIPTPNSNSSLQIDVASCFSFVTSELHEPRNLTQAVQTGDTLDAVRMANCSNLMATLKLRSSNPVATLGEWAPLTQVLIGESLL